MGTVETKSPKHHTQIRRQIHSFLPPVVVGAPRIPFPCMGIGIMALFSASATGSALLLMLACSLLALALPASPSLLLPSSGRGACCFSAVRCPDESDNGSAETWD